MCMGSKETGSVRVDFYLEQMTAPVTKFCISASSVSSRQLHDAGAGASHTTIMVCQLVYYEALSVVVGEW